MIRVVGCWDLIIQHNLGHGSPSLNSYKGGNFELVNLLYFQSLENFRFSNSHWQSYLMPAL